MQRKGQVNLRAVGSELANSRDDAHRGDLSTALLDYIFNNQGHSTVICW